MSTRPRWATEGLAFDEAIVCAGEDATLPSNKSGSRTISWAPGPTGSASSQSPPSRRKRESYCLKVVDRLQTSRVSSTLYAEQRELTAGWFVRGFRGRGHEMGSRQLLPFVTDEEIDFDPR